MRQTLSVSERRICRTLAQHRSTQRKVPRGRGDEERLTADIIELARQYGRYGYRRVTSRVVIEEWRCHYNTVRPHSALGWKPPAPETIVPIDQRPVMH